MAEDESSGAILRLLDVQGRRIEHIEGVQDDLVKEVTALRTEARLMSDSFKTLRNALIGGVVTLLGGIVLLLIQFSSGGGHP